MLLVIEQLLPRDTAAAMHADLQGAQWIDGRHTAGALAVDAKRNRQLADDDALARRLAANIERAARSHPEFVSAALPARMLPPRFNRHDTGEYYGAHVDAALMRTASGELLRADVSATLFLTDPSSYDGGELDMQTSFGVQEVKLAAGDMVLYPSTSLHRVAPVTRGTRICSFFWIESMVADAGRRELLHELDLAIRELRGSPGVAHAAFAAGEGGPLARLTAVYHNLMRSWAQP